jgi:hypothetical protein
LKPLISLAITLVATGALASLLHLVIVWLGVNDLVALLLYAAPIAIYVSYCTRQSRADIVGSALLIYCSFSGVVLAAAGLVYLIGT